MKSSDEALDVRALPVVMWGISSKGVEEETARRVTAGNRGGSSSPEDGDPAAWPLFPKTKTGTLDSAAGAEGGKDGAAE